MSGARIVFTAKVEIVDPDKPLSLVVGEHKTPAILKWSIDKRIVDAVLGVFRRAK